MQNARSPSGRRSGTGRDGGTALAAAAGRKGLASAAAKKARGAQDSFGSLPFRSDIFTQGAMNPGSCHIYGAGGESYVSDIFRFQRVVLLGAAIGTAACFAAPQCCARALQQGLALCGGPLLGVTVPISHRFRSAHALWGRAGTGICVPSGGTADRGAQPGGRWVLLIGFLGGISPGSGCGGRSRRSRELIPAGGVGPSPGLHLLRAVLVILTAGEQLLGSRVLGIRLFAAQVLAGYLPPLC